MTIHAVSVSGRKNTPAEALRQSKQDMAVMFNRDHPDAALIGLGRINGIGWLQELFEEVLIPAVVADEVLSEGLACFRAAATADCSHEAVVISGKQPNDLPEFRRINS